MSAPASDMRQRRGSIFLEQAKVLRQEKFPGDQFILRVHAPRGAAAARPGTFAHITCDAALPMRRPVSIMRASAEDGWLEFLYKIVGEGLSHLSRRQPGDSLSILAPIGEPFRPSVERPLTLLVGGGVGIPPMVFLAETLNARAQEGFRPLVLMGSEIPFPFKAKPSTILLPGMPPEAIACMPLLEGWGVPSRLATKAGYPGCYDGFVTDLAGAWLDGLSDGERARVQMFACGPTPMLKSAASVARRFGVPCQVCLEEFMACGVGGCAGCTVLVRTPEGPAMKRVCVDGPVFDARAVF